MKKAVAELNKAIGADVPVVAIFPQKSHSHAAAHPHDNMAFPDKITSLCGLMKFVWQRSRQQKCKAYYIVKLPHVCEDAIVYGDLAEDCKANIRLGAVPADVSGYKSFTYTTGVYDAVLVASAYNLECVNYDKKSAAYIVVFDFQDMLKVRSMPEQQNIKQIISLISRRFSLNIDALMRRSTANEHGTFCGLVGFVHDILYGHVSKAWLGKPKEDWPPFVDESVLLAIKMQSMTCTIRKLRKLGVFGAPACNNSVKKGLRSSWAQTAPYSLATYVVGGTYDGVQKFLADIISFLKI